jgi:hypothetical protein
VQLVRTIIVEGKIWYVLYFIKVLFSDGVSWEIAHRFSDFLALREALVRDTSLISARLPELPKTIPFGGSDIEPRFVEERKLRLQRFLDDCMRNKGIRGLSLFTHFLGIAEAPEAKSGDLPATEACHLYAGELFNCQQPMLGVRKAVQDKAGCVITACKDTSVVCFAFRYTMC